MFTKYSNAINHLYYTNITFCIEKIHYLFKDIHWHDTFEYRYQRGFCDIFDIQYLIINKEKKIFFCYILNFKKSIFLRKLNNNNHTGCLNNECDRMNNGCRLVFFKVIKDLNLNIYIFYYYYFTSSSLYIFVTRERFQFLFWSCLKTKA